MFDSSIRARYPKERLAPCFNGQLHETAEDLEQLQRLLDDRYAAARSRLKSIITESRRMTASEVVEATQGMSLLVLGTETRAGRPLASAVEGIFYQGRF